MISQNFNLVYIEEAPGGIHKKVGRSKCGFCLPSPKRLPAAQGFGRRGFAQAGIAEFELKHQALKDGSSSQ
jgi:hypothetical protein